MRLATYRHDGAEHTGVVIGDRIHRLTGGLDMRGVVALDPRDLVFAPDGVPLDEVRLRPPIRPASIRDFVAFEEHVAGVRRSVDGTAGVPDAWYDAPTFYFTNPHTVIGPGDAAAFPAACAARDFELEVAAVIGAGGIFGYTILNDWSARDLQSREMQVRLGPAKGKDFATSLGPWIVTADELEPYRDADGFLRLLCTASVNGVEVGRDRLSNMGWTFETMLAYAARDSRVEPGDVLGSGTVGNGGCLAELWGRDGAAAPPPLQPDDVVTLSVEGLGTLTNTVAVAPPGAPLPAFRRPSGAR
ncbi:fumarylacetoacetate hydrolase family protein [Dactylosporangium sp. NPDC051541]|uniref:fumarylacetoacetate hydrolase family protein n=1 Tax=Dactylosporangium sp. NPDC051541 TaxID=3363977 RepID=UPI00378D9350